MRDFLAKTVFNERSGEMRDELVPAALGHYIQCLGRPQPAKDGLLVVVARNQALEGSGANAIVTAAVAHSVLDVGLRLKTGRRCNQRFIAADVGPLRQPVELSKTPNWTAPPDDAGTG